MRACAHACCVFDRTALRDAAVGAGASAAVVVTFAEARDAAQAAQTTVCAHRDPRPVLVEFKGLAANVANPHAGGDPSLNRGTLPVLNVTASTGAVVKTYEVRPRGLLLAPNGGGHLAPAGAVHTTRPATAAAC
jgi:hypothetical protein